jgi:hypothetical protein
LFFFVDASRSQVVDGVEIVKPRIITGDWDDVTKKFPVAVEFTIAKGWHMYWLNPGDAGSPPEVKWSLPMGWKVGKLQFPVPEHHVEDGFESYAYYDKLVLYTEIASPVAPKPSDVIEADIKWMVCKDICVAGKQLIKRPYELTNVHHEWPKLPLVVTLDEAGYKLFGMQNDAETGKESVRSILVSQEGTQGYLKIKHFWPYIESVQPVEVLVDGEMIMLSTKGTAQTLQDANGLIFIGDKVYWLKAP